MSEPDLRVYMDAVDLAATGYGRAIDEHVRHAAAVEAARREALIVAGCEVCREPVATMVVRQLADLTEDVHVFCGVHTNALIADMTKAAADRCICTPDPDRSPPFDLDYDCRVHGTDCSGCGRRIPKPNTVCASCFPGSVLNDLREHSVNYARHDSLAVRDVELEVIDHDGPAISRLIANATAEMRADFIGFSPAITELYRRAGLLPDGVEFHWEPGDGAGDRDEPGMCKTLRPEST